LGASLAVEGMVTFMPEAVFIGIFLFGWEHVGKIQHLSTTFFLALD